MRYREMSIQEISCSEEQCEGLSYSHVTVTAGGVGAQLFRRRYASVAQLKALISAVTCPEPGFLAMLWVSAYFFKNKNTFSRVHDRFSAFSSYIL